MDKFSESLSTGIHARLQSLAGNYMGTSRVWFGPDNLVDESPVEGNLEPVLDGRFLLHRYKGNFQGKPLEGIQLIGYDLHTDCFQVAWVDSFHMSTGILFSTGAKGAGTTQALGSYSTGGEQPQFWGWETVFEKKGSDLVITAYNISPEGERDKATEVVYSLK